MTTLKKKPPSGSDSDLYEDACGDFDGNKGSVDLIEFGMREDIDWQKEGQRVLAMFDHPKPHKGPSKIDAA